MFRSQSDAGLVMAKTFGAELHSISVKERPSHYAETVGEVMEEQEEAAELNPVEYLWGNWKQHELPNVCPKDFGELSRHARRALRRMRRRPTLVAAFWKQSEFSGISFLESAT